MKNSRVPWSPNAAYASESAASGPGARLDAVGVHRHRARRHPRRPHHHPLPPVLDRLDPVVVEDQMRLVVHAVQALDDGLLQLVHDVGALAGDGIDAMDALVVDLDLEVLGPAAVAAQPRSNRSRSRHGAPFYAPGCAPPVRRLARPRRGALRVRRAVGRRAGARRPSRRSVRRRRRRTTSGSVTSCWRRSWSTEVEAVGLPCEVALRQGLGEVEAPTMTIGRIDVNGDNATAEVRSAAAGRSHRRTRWSWCGWRTRGGLRRWRNPGEHPFGVEELLILTGRSR